MKRTSKIALGTLLAGAVAFGAYNLNKSPQTQIPVISTIEPYVPSKVIEVENNFNYVANDIWYQRLDSIESLARANDPRSINPETIKDLEVIARSDDHKIIRTTANSMVRSYKSIGNFSNTRAYQEFQAEKERLTIKTSTDFGYKALDIWYDRMDALADLLVHPDKVNEAIVADLKIITQKEDDPRVARYADNIIRNYNSRKPETQKQKR
ncbi:MAG: hypothetical protein AABW71_02150 [Nanoarchaeota archaeon]